MTGENFSQAGLGSVRRGLMINAEPRHRECGRPGKFDCSFDEAVHEITMELGESEGHVDAPCAWFVEIELVEDERGLMDHYGTRWLIARENSQGFFWVEGFATEKMRDERLDGLREAWIAWEDGE
jgi:hypothetical protein